ncbi:hypothetical protein BDN72DRAFT_614369 [Pluteus cervinus]|uniref:Uncharacterized protein n=1 Tax=Pluteus cervinus TaxID=181527 RepID=A0ACD3AVP2_9AGAR|nr:hypothetical protein BDN72DRAFT_614369 [Pluteus cervinus]
MPPRATRSQGSGSSSTPVGVKAERQVKHEKQPDDKGKGKRRAVVDSDEDEANIYNPSQEEAPRSSPADEDAEGEVEEEEEDTGSSHGRKRARVDAEGNARPVDIIPTKPRVATLPRDVDGFIPGSIVRIQLQNFVTYDYVQFRTGPHLNMILGPNGTGKSTIACAIAIGLNWPPSGIGSSVLCKAE